MKSNVILIGYMGCGKSTVGSKLADELDYTFLDTDAWIEEKEGIAIKEIFASKGEEYFRNLETICIKELIREKNSTEFSIEDSEYERKYKEEGVIISVGGGLPVREENQKLLKELGTVIYLKANSDTIYERVKSDTTRPLLQTENPQQKIKDMLAYREGKYQAAAHVIVNVDEKSILEIIEEIKVVLGNN